MTTLEDAATALAMLLDDIRPIGPDEPPERVIPAQHRVMDIRQARMALARAEDAADDVTVTVDGLARAVTMPKVALTGYPFFASPKTYAAAILAALSADKEEVCGP